MARNRNRPEVPFSKLLNSLMKEKGMGVREAARIAGVNASTLQSWRAGALPENFMAVKKLAEGLGTTMSFLLTGQDDSRKTGPLVAEVFGDGGVIFDGYCKITVERLVPRK